ncbi:MAG: MBL fold metallo-hydrolase [Proteobacteria bacterium]|nr:MBL fold metallo-hydrolase [Pseudomonadota bacterium]
MTSRVGKLAVTVLSDNCVASGEGLLAEHGLSLLIEADGRSLLFDVGNSGICIGNAARLGLDLTQARQIVLSHAHYDHTGALPLLLNAFGPRQLIAHPDLFQRKYARRRGHAPREIGLPSLPQDLVRQGAVLRLDSQPREVLPGVLTTGTIPRVTDFEAIPSHFAVKRGTRMVRDEFAEEQALVAQTRKGLVVIVGCSHRGVINALRHAVELTGEERVHALIGGTHLAAAGQEQLQKTIEELQRMKLAQVIACHCTGFRAAARLAAALGDRFDPGGVGYRLTV